jgi:hypothetical protein
VSHAAYDRALNGGLGALSMASSQIGDDRPLSSVSFMGDGKVVVTGSWSGSIKAWAVPSGELLRSYTGAHTERVSDVCFHPGSVQADTGRMGFSHTTTNGKGGSGAGKGAVGKAASQEQEQQACADADGGADSTQANSVVHFASSACDSVAKLWSLHSRKPLASFVGHRNRLGRVAWHPSGDYLGTASFDGTWRLWDIRTQQSVLEQGGGLTAAASLLHFVLAPRLAGAPSPFSAGLTNASLQVVLPLRMKYFIMPPLRPRRLLAPEPLFLSGASAAAVRVDPVPPAGPNLLG